MISIEDFKKALPEDHNLTEKKILKLRIQMDQMANLAFEIW